SSFCIDFFSKTFFSGITAFLVPIEVGSSICLFSFFVVLFDTSFFPINSFFITSFTISYAIESVCKAISIV
ncbi:hypothetical protein ACOTV2_11655, partial [Aliarcobacter butzleri]